MEVHTIRRTMVKPSIPTPTHLQELGPSYLDQIQPSDLYVLLLLHYHAGGGVVLEDKIHHLEKSLSETLSVFYPLAGRYGKAGGVINCNDQGVEFVEAKVNGKLDQFLLQLDGSSDEALLALPSSSAIKPGSSLPFVAIQVNVFECGGLVVSVQMSHIASDMFSMCAFLNEWATVSRQGTLQPVVRRDFDLPLLLPPQIRGGGDGDAIVKSFESAFDASSARSKTTTYKIFSFKNEGLSRLSDDVTSPTILASSDGKIRRPSRVELLSALICKVLVSVDRVKYGRSRPVAVAHAVNLRGRTALPIKDNVFGNFLIGVTSSPLTTISDNDSELFHKLVQLVGDTLRDAIIEVGKVKDVKDLVQEVETSERKALETMTKGDTNLAIFTSWCKFPLYGVDYGWGRPALVRTEKSIYGNVFFLMDAESGDGIDAWATLEDDEMNYFEHDPDILKYICQQP